ncbi:MAG: tetratricopeptide repeat protein [Spirochaetes bacterium]|nr:tetratricopeptide repeat protein [Spirochaetota bacterium]
MSFPSPIEAAGLTPGGRRRSQFYQALCLAACFFLAISCSDQASLYVSQEGARQGELKTLFRLLEKHGSEGEEPDQLAHFAAARKIGAVLISSGRASAAAAFLTKLAEGQDAYAAWYLFTAAAAYESQGDLRLAVPLYERIVRTLPDMIVEGKSLHYEALTRLAGAVEMPERRIGYFKDLIARFPEAPDVGSSQFLLAKAYEKTGAWKEALEHYAAFLPYFGAKVPGYPDAHDYARRLVEFNASPKDWTYENLEELVASLRKALLSGSARQLRKYSAKAGFFAISWFQDGGIDANSKVNFDLNQFMQGRPIRSSPTLDPSSGSREAYLKTWGWTGRVPVWYLYLRKVDFPADPDVHGRWEWAGIYFGERMQ